MNINLHNNYLLFNDSLHLFSSMIDDIKNAKKRIFLEVYRFSNDSIGQKFRDELTKKAKEGLEVMVLIDSWGAGVNERFFVDFIAHGGQLRFFKKIKFSLDFFLKNHRRNHRKLLLIDSNISYVGSSNITAYCLSWRESTLRMKGKICSKFEKIFKNDYDFSSKVYKNKKENIKVIESNGFEILRDIPSTISQPVKKKFLKLIRNAESKIVIETPYFLTGAKMRKALFNAVKRGVKVTVIFPKNSDVILFDILRNRYLGLCYKNNINIKFYTPSNLHSKIFIVDNKQFCLGSSNFDYRSFRFMFEINLLGNDENIISQLNKHVNKTLKDCADFDYLEWKNRHVVLKIIELILVPVRHLF